jgi:hypothetical protein
MAGSQMSQQETANGVVMADYKDILRFLASNPPQHEPEKRMHASLLEMLAKKLRGEEVDIEKEALKMPQKLPTYNKRLH